MEPSRHASDDEFIDDEAVENAMFYQYNAYRCMKCGDFCGGQLCDICLQAAGAQHIYEAGGY